jgi:hypothetical protein
MVARLAAMKRRHLVLMAAVAVLLTLAAVAVYLTITGIKEL